jgi:hypothetical protein
VQKPPLFRLIGLAGLGVLVAAVSHGGTAVVERPAWVIAALGGALVAVGAVVGGWRALTRGSGVAGERLPVAVLASGLIAAELAGHWLLVASGAPAHTGETGSLALHTVLALVAAVLVRGIERAAATRLAGSGDGLTEDRPDPASSPPRRPHVRLVPTQVRGRAPPAEPC